MVNPFEKRASEYLRDDEAFLSVVSPEPLLTFFTKPANEDRLFDRLVMIIGTPGSGKTTMARLFQYSTIHSLLRNASHESYRPVIAALADCGAVADGAPTVIGTRIPLESEYRDFWEFPYDDDLKLGLMTALVQSRAVLGWIQSLQAAGVAITDIRFVPRENAKAASEAMGGTDTADILARATEVERALYRVSAALVPPTVDTLPSAASTAFRPFDVIEHIMVVHNEGTTTLRPLVILDDAHTLHATQFELLHRWLARRELRVARWVITRFDALTPSQVLMAPGLSTQREITQIRMQNDGRRQQDRTAFRKMAKDMSTRYLRRWDTFSRRGLHDLASMLSTTPETLSPSKLRTLSMRIDTVQRRNAVTDARRSELETTVEDYLKSQTEEDVRLAVLAITIARYLIRTRPKTAQLDLFGGEQTDDPAPSRPITVDSDVVEGARIHLLHEFGRPYYFGIDALCDSSSENAEQFLQLASVLVSQLETKLIRKRPRTLSAREQDRLLRERAAQLVDAWNFPYSHAVRNLVDGIAQQCIERSMEPNAPLGGGAVAFGILQHEFETIPSEHSRLAHVLQFAVAYNAITLVPDYRTKNQRWCLIELGGIPLLKYGLTLRRGGFIECELSDLADLLDRPRSG